MVDHSAASRDAQPAGVFSQGRNGSPQFGPLLGAVVHGHHKRNQSQRAHQGFRPRVSLGPHRLAQLHGAGGNAEQHATAQVPVHNRFFHAATHHHIPAPDGVATGQDNEVGVVDRQLVHHGEPGVNEVAARNACFAGGSLKELEKLRPVFV